MCVVCLLCAACKQHKIQQPRAVVAWQPQGAPASGPPSAAGRPAKGPAPTSWQTPSPMARFYEKTKTVDAGTVATPVVEAPKGPPPDAMNKAMQAAMPALATCFQGTTATGGTVNVHFDAEPSGRARGIRVSGADDRAESCIRATLLTVALPTFEGTAAIGVDFPMTLAARESPPAAHAVEVPGPAVPIKP